MYAHVVGKIVALPSELHSQCARSFPSFSGRRVETCSYMTMHPIIFKSTCPYPIELRGHYPGGESNSLLPFIRRRAADQLPGLVASRGGELNTL